MKRQPRGDDTAGVVDVPSVVDWSDALQHRRLDSPAALAAVVERLESAGVTPEILAIHLADGGDSLYAAARSGSSGWAELFGGDRAVALIAAEVSALMSHLVARAAGVRSVCVDTLLDEYSAVTVAGALGVSRQKVYDLAKPNLDRDFIDTAPWRRQ